MKSKVVFGLFVGSALSAWPLASMAQETAAAQAKPADDAGAGAGLDEIVVTGTARPETKLTTSISISSLSLRTIEQVAPLSSADILREIPGIRSESSGGEGNANISVRGLPVASGGAKFIQFQEDGIPVLDFGDIAFATADTFVKADYNLDKLEVVRGGSASTFTSNAPGAVINFITKTGTKEGGAIGLTEGLDYDRTRLDFDYGGAISEGWRFHVGGFYRSGEGVRTADYTAEDGGQFKGNVTRELENGFLRFDFKYLNDSAPAYLPVPVSITGSSDNPSVSSLPGFNVTSGALQTPALLNTLSLDHTGTRLTTDLADGYHTESKAFGGEASFDLKGGWTLDDKFRVAINSGDFVGPYPANVDTALNLATSIGGAGATLRYASGANAGQLITNPGGLNGNGLAVNTVLFNVTLNDFDTYTNVLKIAKDFDLDRFGDGSITVGYFRSGQHIGMDWHWTDYLLEARGKDAQLLDVYNAQGQAVTDHGLIAYDARAFGDCCVRNYDVQYTIDAPYINLGWKYGDFDFDGSVRYDIANADGTYGQSTGSGTAIDVNQDGVISVPEQKVLVVNNAAALPVNYTKRYVSYSIGGNYAINPDLALFARVSRGARFNADRALPPNSDGSVPDFSALNFVDQQEGGVKWRQNAFSLFVTGFHAETEEQGTDITPSGLTVYARTYESYGAELEGAYHYGSFQLTGGVTYTHSRITGDQQIGATDIGSVPQRQAEWIFQFTPSYETDEFAAGINVIGTTDSYATQPNGLVMPGYTVVNLFGQYFINENLRVSINANNVFDTIGLTEIDQAPGPNGVGSARSIPGRTVTAGIKYSF